MIDEQGIRPAIQNMVWGPDQDQAFENVKEELTQPSVLALYDPEARAKVAANAS